MLGRHRERVPVQVRVVEGPASIVAMGLADLATWSVLELRHQSQSDSESHLSLTVYR